MRQPTDMIIKATFPSHRFESIKKRHAVLLRCLEQLWRVSFGTVKKHWGNFRRERGFYPEAIVLRSFFDTTIFIPSATSQILLVCDWHDDCLPQKFELHASMEPLELRVHGPRRASLPKIL